MKRKFILFFLPSLICSVLLADVKDREIEIQQAILALHTSQGPSKKNIIWNECGKFLRGEKAMERAGEYARAILGSIDLVKEKTGEEINPDYVAAVLYRESSCDECAIGKQEVKRLTKNLGYLPTKVEIIEYIRKWTGVYINAQKNCKIGGKSFDMKCIDWNVMNTGPQWQGIYGWDLGVAQYRWPGPSYGRQVLELPGGEIIEKVGLEEIFDLKVSIQMLVNDLARYRKDCRNHIHWRYTKTGQKIEQLDSESVYFVHHHSVGLWSERYWKAVKKHLNVIRKDREEKSTTAR